ncbi:MULTISPECIES: hypothetical protein [unclassified Viridibacillus]|uniref:hypothetical protein n=1 Tax=unclassified Viridibacillus TaxID=2617942 RepID=UPI0030F982D4
MNKITFEIVGDVQSQQKPKFSRFGKVLEHVINLGQKVAPFTQLYTVNDTNSVDLQVDRRVIKIGDSGEGYNRCELFVDAKDVEEKMQKDGTDEEGN